MRKNRDNLPHAIDTPSVQPEEDNSSTASSMRDQIVFGTKLIAIAGILFLMFWLFERM